MLIARGGTGNTTGNAATATKLKTARIIQTNLASANSVNFDGTANVAPGVTGTLPIANGGTGATTAAAARSALGLGNTSGALPIANGGTGATTAEKALSNLGGFPKSGGRINGDVEIRGTVAEGSSTASGDYSHAEGSSTASGWCSHAEGYNTTASSWCSHAEGGGTEASGDYSHAAGSNTIASGMYSYAGGYNATASGYCSHAEGSGIKASANSQTAIGKWNKESTSMLDRFIIGDGTSDTARSNCFRVTELAGVYSNNTYQSSGADYAEMFEWLDGNVKNQDRKGLFVTLEMDKIRIATPLDDYILGIVSACPSVCGDVNDDTWGDMYKKTIWGTPILEEVEIPEKTEEIKTINENGEEMKETIVVEPAHIEIRRKLNPEYDHTQQYIPRSDRPEWDAVGMMGKLVVIDDGSCEINGWCKVGKGGIATKSEQKTRFRVMKRLNENHIKVLVL